ncbi:hypothetical protein JKP88DRAFT_316135 [Tribonema minus]|uniref:SET domain-containing protein n=1 Tax=Tribonema minus TaxID=303371 RepID=A0A835YYH0_9STRA|nr:hypothetical protein JKP88DRAFT_316135 [Tribonema minus]
MNTTADSAWACFGSDDEDEGSVAAPTPAPPPSVTSKRTLPDAQLPWFRLIPVGLNTTTSTSQAPPAEVDTASIAPFQHQPLLQAPCLRFSLLPNRGGGRGMVVDTDVAPGTLLLAETPVVPMASFAEREEAGIGPEEMCVMDLLMEPPEEAGPKYRDAQKLHPQCLPNAASRRRGRCCEQSSAPQRRCSQPLARRRRTQQQQRKRRTHPCSPRSQDLAAVSPDKLRQLRARHDAVIAAAAETDTARALGLRADDVLRLLCALHWNGWRSRCCCVRVAARRFETGMYLHHAMLNHSCRPNCIKWAGVDAQYGGRRQQRSDLQAVRHIPAGSEVTVNYIEPPEQSLRSRSRLIAAQFDFKCACELCTITPQSPLAPLEEVTGADREAAAAAEGAFAAELDALERGMLAARDGDRPIAWGAVLCSVLRAGAPVEHCLGARHLTVARGHRLVCLACADLLADAPALAHVAADEWRCVAAAAAPLLLPRSGSGSRATAAVAAAATAAAAPGAAGVAAASDVAPVAAAAAVPSVWLALLALLLASALRLREAHLLLLGPGPHAAAAANLYNISQGVLLSLAQGAAGEALLANIGALHGPGAETATDWARFASACEKASRSINTLYGAAQQ